MSKHRPPGALQGQSRHSSISFLLLPSSCLLILNLYYFGYERGLDLKVSYKFSSILGMLTDVGT